MNEQITPFANTFGVENIVPTTNRSSASPQNPDMEQVVTNAPEISLVINIC